VRFGPLWVSSGGRRRRPVTARAVIGSVCLIAVADAVCSGGWWVVLGWTVTGLGAAVWLLYLMGRRTGRREAQAAATKPPPPRSPRMYHSGRR
jgi:hypothetical protein